jgi:amidase
MKQYDFLAAPVVQVLPFDVNQSWVTQINGQRMDSYLDWMKSCYFITVTGMPAISVPCGFGDNGVSAGGTTRTGLPVGLQIAGRHNDDFGVLQLAHAFEQQTGFWKTRPASAAA